MVSAIEAQVLRDMPILEAKLVLLGESIEKTEEGTRRFGQWIATRVDNMTDDQSRADRLNDQRIEALSLAIQNAAERVDKLVGILAKHGSNVEVLKAHLEANLKGIKEDVGKLLQVVIEGTETHEPLSIRVLALESAVESLEEAVTTYTAAEESRRAEEAKTAAATKSDMRRGAWALAAAATPGIIACVLELVRTLGSFLKGTP